VPALESDYLVPSGPVLLLLVVPLALLLILPLGQALHRGRLGWAVAIVLLSPWAGICWWLFADRRRMPA
jgi:hypothetical protein